MKIALLTDSIGSGSPGFSRYARALSEALPAVAPQHEYVLVHPGGDGFYGDRAHLQFERGFPLTRQVAWPPRLDAAGFDLVHDTYHFGPFVRPSRFVRVLTVGDLTPLVTTTHRLKARWMHRLVAPLIARRAHHVVTFSESSKRDIVRLFHLPDMRITVTHLAAATQFRPVPAASVAEAQDRLQLPPRYVLHVGTLEPRKNIERLLRAYAAALPSLPGVSLVLVGGIGWRMSGLRALLRSLDLDRLVHIRSDIGDDDLPSVYTGAFALVYPSLYEGFGLPPLEAMQCGVPVVTSNTSSLPEVVGDSALTVDPTSIDQLAAAIVRVVSDDRLRMTLARSGIERASRFSWRRCAERTACAYEAAVQYAQSSGRPQTHAATVK